MNKLLKNKETEKVYFLLCDQLHGQHFSKKV